VAPRPPARPGDRKRLLQQEVEELVVEAMRIGLDLEEVVEAIETQWQKIGNTEVVRR
jgi:GntR family transcriptional regulator